MVEYLGNINKFEDYVEANEIMYSGAYCWNDALRSHLIYLEAIGPNKSIKSLEELAEYEGNTFISGCGYFLNAHEVRHIVESKQRIRYDEVFAWSIFEPSLCKL